jgi:hypothetical protein
VTTERGALLVAAALLGLGCADMHESRRGDRVDVSSYPPDIQAAYEVFARRCSRCHTLARPLNARITDPQHWVRYVARMRRQPGSGIDHSNADIILKFLLYYHRPDRDEPEPAPAEPREPPPEPPPQPSFAPPPPEPEAPPDDPQPALPPAAPEPPEGVLGPGSGADTTGAASAPQDAPQGGNP